MTTKALLALLGLAAGGFVVDTHAAPPPSRPIGRLTHSSPQKVQVTPVDVTPVHATAPVTPVSYSVPMPPPEPAATAIEHTSSTVRTTELDVSVDRMFPAVYPASGAYHEPVPTPTEFTNACSCDGCIPCDSCCGVTDLCSDSCDGCDVPECEPGDESCFETGGWLSFGYHSRDNGLFNNRPDKANVHQLWMFAERVADGSEGFDWGFRADIIYGQDAADTQAFGNNPGEWDYQNGWDRGAGYGWAMPQLYAEAAIGDLSVKIGHFYTLLGYEVVTAPDNFFYSHAFTMYNSEAFTHTGTLSTWSATDSLTLYFGHTFGWDTGYDQFVQNGQDGSSFLGGYSIDVADDIAFTHIVTAGDLGWRGDGWSQSLVADVTLTDGLNYVIQSDLLQAEDFETIGVNQYLLYTYSDCLGFGARYEWWKSDGVSINAITAGVNLRPSDDIVFRPEIRYQWDPGANNGVLSADSVNEVIASIDCVMTF